MDNQTLYTLILLGVCVLVSLLLWKCLRRIIGKVVCIVIAAIVFCVGAKVIDLNTLSSDMKAKIAAVSEAVDTTYIKTQGNDILININGEWLNLSNLSVIGDLSGDLVLEYDGQEIYLGHSGVYNTIKALEEVGLLK